MPLAIDFGTSNTVVGVWDEASGAGRPLLIPDVSTSIYDGAKDVPVVPSLISYCEEGRLIGRQVSDHNLKRSPQTVRWMKLYIVNRNPGTIQPRDRPISRFEAGKDFLSEVVRLAIGEADAERDEVVFTVPLETSASYSEWIEKVAAQAGVSRLRVLDEASAAVVGHGASVRPGDACLLFDYGGEQLDVAVVLMEEEMTAIGGCRSRVLGKARGDIGGSYIDGLLMQHLLGLNKWNEKDEGARVKNDAFLLGCQRAKEQLSHCLSARIETTHPETSEAYTHEVTRSEFEYLLSKHRVYDQVLHVVRQALGRARELGYGKEEIKAVLPVGGSSLIPSIRRLLEDQFECPVSETGPVDAVATGAATLAGGIRLSDELEHDYAIRYLEPDRGIYDYYRIVASGTRYPTRGPITTLTIKASHKGQTHMGMTIMEIGERKGRRCLKPIAIIYRESGVANLVDLDQQENRLRRKICMNEHAVILFEVEPPARYAGEARFRIEFAVDAHRNLLITSRDLESGEMIHSEEPVARLY